MKLSFAGFLTKKSLMIRIPPLRDIYFTVDRPFLYLILTQDKVIFAGTYTH